MSAESARFPAPSPEPRSRFIVSPIFDGVFFIFSPLLALALGAAFGGTNLATRNVPGYVKPLLGMLVGSFTMAHLFIVFFRSHGNRDIFRTYPLRFTLVPALLLAGFFFSPPVRVAGVVLAVFWDVYHSSLQTFGLGRIYDRLAGNAPDVGRTLDVGLNHLLYIGPIVAGAAFLAHVEAFYSFDSIGQAFLTSIPARARLWHAPLALAVFSLAVPFLIYYLLAYRRLARQGYRVSPQKIALFASTAICSVWAWGFNAFGVAFLIMNFFHAMQYFALVGWSEKGRIDLHLPLLRGKWLAAKAFLAITVVGFAYGAWAELQRARLNASVLAVTILTTVSLLHFWYDGFIWSVRKSQV